VAEKRISFRRFFEHDLDFRDRQAMWYLFSHSKINGVIMRRIILFCFLCTSLFGQTKNEPRANDPWAPSASYNPTVPTIESVLGYKAGEKFSPYSNLERY